MRGWVVLIVLACLSFPASSFSAELATAEPATAEPATAEPAIAEPAVSALLTQAKAWYDQRENPEAVPKAMELYQQLLAQDPKNYEALWRLTRCYWWQGDHAPKGRQMALYDLGQQTGEKARAAAPEGVDGHYWFGACVGRAAEVRGVLNSLFAVDTIRKAMETVLSLDPQYGSAHYVLGVLYRKAPGWPLSCGDLNKALEHGRKGVELSPLEVLPYVGLAETLLAKGEKAEAKQLLEKALTLDGPPDLQPETKMHKEDAQKLLKNNF